MAFIWSIVTGVLLSYVLKSGWGFFLGLFIGPMLYRTFNNIAPMRGAPPSPTLFLTVSFEVLGHLSKAKGEITRSDINLANHFMDQLKLDSNGRTLAQNSFNRGKSSDYPLRERLRELYSQYRTRRNVSNIFCEQLIQAAISDGVLHDKEQQILFIVAEEFRIPKAQMAMYIQMMMGSYHFRQQGSQQGYQQERRYQYQQGYSNGGYQQRPSAASELQNAYQILGVPATAEVTAIKRAYRKLMNEHHPDKLVSKGLPKEMLEEAKKRAQEIQSAYDLIKTQRGFK